MKREETYSKNDRKVMAPMYILDFLKESKGNRTQKEIRDMLWNYHGIALGRSAVARDIHLLANEELCIGCDRSRGVWYDRKLFDEYYCGDSNEDDEDYDDVAEMNDRRLLLPLFIREILMNNTSYFRHYSKTDILDELDRYPYSIYVSQTALARYIHLLLDECDYIHRDDTGRVYYEPVYKWAA